MFTVLHVVEKQNVMIDSLRVFIFLKYKCCCPTRWFLADDFSNEQ